MRVRDGTRAEKRAATTKYIDSFNLSVETPSRGVSTGYERRSAVGRHTGVYRRMLERCSRNATSAITELTSRRNGGFKIVLVNKPMIKKYP